MNSEDENESLDSDEVKVKMKVKMSPRSSLPPVAIAAWKSMSRYCRGLAKMKVTKESWQEDFRGNALYPQRMQLQSLIA